MLPWSQLPRTGSLATRELCNVPSALPRRRQRMAPRGLRHLLEDRDVELQQQEEWDRRILWREEKYSQ